MPLAVVPKSMRSVSSDHKQNPRSEHLRVFQGLLEAHDTWHGACARLHDI